MFRKEERLRKQKDIERVFAGRLSFFNPFFILRAQFNQQNMSRKTVVVSKKVAKRAVDRNGIKRYLRPLIKKQNIPEGLDIVVLCLKDPRLNDRGEILSLMERSFSKLAKSAQQKYAQADKKN